MHFSPRPRLPTFRTARTAAALVLLVAAVLKARHIEFSPITTHGIWTRPVQMGLVEYELGLAVRLFLGVFARPLRWLTAATFTAFAAYSLALWAGGAKTCRCFGAAEVHPSVSFALDSLLMLAVLFGTTKPQKGDGPATTANFLSSFASQFRLLGATAGCAAAIFFPAHAAAWPSLARMTGYPLIVERPLQVVAVPKADEESVAEFTVRNATQQAITILGAQTSCGCAQIDQLPMIVEPHSRTLLRFRVAPTGSGQTVTHEARLFIDRPSPRIMLRAVVRAM
ncbi:MAG TPA: MauE/DoxX family redox-associated membrane protein, partial [Pirellulales bacterium]|nr:MauE/DoxX family redox-associated membrane protein [Pirellulales bacterium]